MKCTCSKLANGKSRCSPACRWKCWGKRNPQKVNESKKAWAKRNKKYWREWYKLNRARILKSKRKQKKPKAVRVAAWLEDNAVAHKYSAKAQVTEDGRFDSKKELKVWEELKLLQQCGEITELTRDRKSCTFELHGLDGSVVCRYIADYLFKEDGKDIVGDAKGVRTGEYVIKRKLFVAEYKGFVHREY